MEFLKNQQLGNIYDSDIQQKMESMGAASGDGAGSPGGGNERDQYFVDAAQFIIEKDKASIGMLQRVFKIGFNRQPDYGSAVRSRCRWRRRGYEAS